MNYNFLCDIFRNNREYSSLCSELRAPVLGKRKPYSVSGLTDGSEFIFLATIASDFASVTKPAVFVFPDEKKASSFNEFLVSMNINSALFPAREYCFNNLTSSHAHESERVSVLASLAGILPEEESYTVICTTAEAALQITMPSDILDNLCITVNRDEPLDIVKLAEELTEAGYMRTGLVESPGQFSIRGGIADVYSTTGKCVRIELFGDEIDRMGFFAVDTQRFTGNAGDSVVFTPAREFHISDDTRKYLSDTLHRYIKRIGNTKDADDKHTRAVQTLNSELQIIEHGFELSFADKYLPVIYPEGTCLIDYTDGVIFVTETSATSERVKAQTSLIEQSLQVMVESLELPPIKDGSYMRSFDEITERQSSPVVLIDVLSHFPDTSGHSFLFNARHVPAYAGNIALLGDDIGKYTAAGYIRAVICSSDTEKKALTELFVSDEYSVVSADDGNLNAEEFLKSKKTPIILMTGEFCGGFELTVPKFIIMDFSRESSRPSRGRYLRTKQSRKKKASEAILSYADLTVGDIVVHETYGIGQYMGLENITVDGCTRDCVRIKYSGDDALLLPVEQLDKVSKYIGAGSDTGAVKLSKMGGAEWGRAKSKAKAATREMAKELIELYARRKRTPGIAYSPDDEMCREFADSFEYDETEGQLNAIDDIRADMEKPYPMDRLLCGDVGYGKTEVALRAAFKAVCSGKQVAVLVPTTILAYQHYQTFLSRMRAFPVKIDMVSRFRTKQQQDLSIRKVKRGETDIIIGTHRLISKDVEFYDLGLIIIDEEQRFGVTQKERLKTIAVNADILTLTATPIPRTLNMAMGGIVDMSVLEEAPGMRSPVQTYVMEYDDALIFEAIRRELRRGGQVFYLFNRVDGIYGVAEKIQNAIPDAHIAVAHGQMSREEIEDIWNSMIKGEVDILVCTTIIETGVDIPNANTLIIENSEMYGLSQLHQLRGRVGRSSTRAFAYFTYKKGKELTEIAQQRLSAIRQYAEFGAGFRIALRDLEIRGAGNLLGADQHGHLDAVGYDMYMKLLEEAVIEEKGEPVKKELPDCIINIHCDAYLTKEYVPSAPQRMDMYKRIARIETEADYDDILDEMCDRYGEPDSSAVNLCRIARIRALGRKLGFVKIEEKDAVVKLYRDTIDPPVVQALSTQNPSYQMRILPGQPLAIVIKNKTRLRNTEFIMDVLMKYGAFMPKS